MFHLCLLVFLFSLYTVYTVYIKSPLLLSGLVLCVLQAQVRYQKLEFLGCSLAGRDLRYCSGHLLVFHFLFSILSGYHFKGSWTDFGVCLCPSVLRLLYLECIPHLWHWCCVKMDESATKMKPLGGPLVGGSSIGPKPLFFQYLELALSLNFKFFLIALLYIIWGY